MTYVPGFKYDIFISYSRVDDQPAPGESKGWVKQFHEYLQYELARRFGSYDSVSVWLDAHYLAGGMFFDDQNRQAIDDSAIFIALTSRGYLAEGSYGRKELAWFYRKAQGERAGLVVGTRSRIFNVLLQNIPHQEWPEEISGMSGFRFYDSTSPDDIGYPAHTNQEVFREQIRQLIGDIEITLRSLKSLAEHSSLFEESEPIERPVAPEKPRPELQAGKKSEDKDVQSPATDTPSNIFICYRRGETLMYAGRLHDWLTERFGKGRVFMDYETIDPGDDFAEVIAKAVSSCAVLLALINKQWANAVNDRGEKRLNNPEDFVRLEISTALERGVRVIPILLQGASMPQSQELPPPLSALARRQALEISDMRWEPDVNRLISVLEKHLPKPS